MELKPAVNKKAGYLDKIREDIKNPRYSIFIIPGIPFIFALIGVLLDSVMYSIGGFFAFIIGLLFILFVFVGPLASLAYYAYHSENKLLSAILGLLVFPLMFFYADLLGAILRFQSQILIRIFKWPHIYGIFDECWEFSLIFALIGFLVTFRKKEYLAIALLLSILMFVKYISLID